MIKPMIPYLAFISLAFYLLPLATNDTGSGMFMLLLVIPAACFACSVFYGARHSFQIVYSLIVAILFLPSLFTYYNYTAWVYVFAYGIIALAGNAAGTIFYKRKKQKPKRLQTDE